MDELHITHFTESKVYLDAVQPYDDSFMNFALGSFMDSSNPEHPRFEDPSIVVDRVLLAVYKGDKLTVTLTKIANNFAWMCSASSDAEEQFSPEVFSNSMRLLASFLPSVVDPVKMDSLIGPRNLVNTFIEAWVKEMQDRGTPLKALDPYFSSQLSYATLATLPLPSPLFDEYKIVQVVTEDEADLVAPLSVDFTSHGPKKATLDEAKGVLRAAAKMKTLWACWVEGEIAGYSLMGRATPRTIAIRNVYVSPTHRRKGIAEAMVRALTRFYLGAEPLGFVGAPSPKPDIGVREEVCLNVVEEAVVRLYKRCGFLLGEGDVDPASGKKGSIQTLWRGVGPL